MPGSNYPLLKVMDNTPCAVNTYCTYTLKCYSCSAALGYFLEEGLCFKDVCRKYQLYNSTAGSFDSSLCYCMEGYYSAGVTCSRCHFTCKTCTSSTSNTCVSCPTGWTLSSGSCSRLGTTTVKEEWTRDITASLTGTSGTFTINRTLASNTASCNGVTWLFGFNTYTVSFTGAGSITLNYQPVRLTYASTSFSNGAHYGVHFRATFLFIDQWKSTMSIFFRESNRDIYSYNYLM